MKRYGSPEYVLGVTASPKSVQAVLVHDTSAGPVILKKFHRPRGQGGAFAPLTPEISDYSSGDASFHVGGTQGAPGSLFLGSEFGSGGDMDGSPGLPDSSFKMDYSETPMSMYEQAERFDLELLDIITEVRNAGYEDFRVAFSIGSSFLEAEELRLGELRTKVKKDSSKSSKDKSDKKGKKKSAKRSRGRNSSKSNDLLLEALDESHEGEYDADKVIFLPMKARKEGQNRSLAVFSTALEPVTPTIAEIRERKRPMPPIDLLDTEYTLYHGLARAAYIIGSESVESSKSKEEGRVLFVRAGVGDTIVMFLEGEELVLFESLRSITAIDPPETICSRVLLLQDEFGLGDADMVVLLGEERESGLVESFRTFFPDTRVELLRTFLPKHAGQGNLELHGEAILAAAVTLRVLGGDVYRKVFPPVNFLPKELMKEQFQLPFSWQLAAMYGVLFCTSLFFVYRYFAQRHAMELYRYELSHYPEDLIEANTADLQFKIDSLRSQTVGFLTSLDVLDSLLVGSDAWSRALEKTADVSADVRGIWIERWREDGPYLRLEGNATDRDEVVAFATQSDATIETLSFSEIRGWPVYSFSMRRTIPRELPKAAIYLRNNVRLEPTSDSAQGEAATETPVGD